MAQPVRRDDPLFSLRLIPDDCGPVKANCIIDLAAQAIGIKDAGLVVIALA